MSGFWLRCDACNKQLPAETAQEMVLAIRFKPSLVRRVEPVHLLEHRHRCRSCGWVNVFVPAAAVAAAEALTPNWRNSIVLK